VANAWQNNELVRTAKGRWKIVAAALRAQCVAAWPGIVPRCVLDLSLAAFLFAIPRGLCASK